MWIGGTIPRVTGSHAPSAWATSVCVLKRDLVWSSMLASNPTGLALVRRWRGFSAFVQRLYRRASATSVISPGGIGSPCEGVQVGALSKSSRIMSSAASSKAKIATVSIGTATGRLPQDVGRPAEPAAIGHDQQNLSRRRAHHLADIADGGVVVVQHRHADEPAHQHRMRKTFLHLLLGRELLCFVSRPRGHSRRRRNQSGEAQRNGTERRNYTKSCVARHRASTSNRQRRSCLTIVDGRDRGQIN